MCRNEKISPFSSLVECEGILFRLSFVSRPPTVMTPVVFSTEFTLSTRFRHTETYVGTFLEVCWNSRRKLQPPLIEGVFTSGTEGRMTFNYNPGKMFQYNVQTTVLSRLCLGVRVGIPVRLSFSVVPPSPQNSSGLVYPFPKDFQEAEDDSPIVEDRFGGIPSDGFLKDVANHSVFGGQIAIGLPENEFFPTLSYSDFFNLDRGRKLKWDVILKCVKTKYERRASADPPTRSRPIFANFWVGYPAGISTGAF